MNRRGPDVLAAVLPLLLLVAIAEGDDVLLTHQRSQAVEVGQHGGAVSRHDREIHGSHLAVRLRLGLVEVGMPIQEEQPVAAQAPQAERAADQVAAVAAEHDGEGASTKLAPDGIGEPAREARPARLG